LSWTSEKTNLSRNLHRERYFIEYGSKRLSLEHVALVPKGRFLTVAMIGKRINDAVLPRDSQQTIHDFLAQPQIDCILLGIEATHIACAGSPRMNDRDPARRLPQHRLVAAGKVSRRLRATGP
jgi:hypothetical protein